MTMDHKGGAGKTTAGIDLRSALSGQAGGRVSFSIVGMDQNGTSRTGRYELTCPELTAQVKRWFRNGWRSLQVHTPNGTDVAGIGPHPDTGRRTWWSEAE